MLSTLVQPHNRIYLGEIHEAGSHMPYPLHVNSVPSSLHHQQLQLNLVAYSKEGSGKGSYTAVWVKSPEKDP